MLIEGPISSDLCSRLVREPGRTSVIQAYREREWSDPTRAQFELLRPCFYSYIALAISDPCKKVNQSVSPCEIK